MNMKQNRYIKMILYALLLIFIVRLAFFGISITLNMGPRSDHFYLTRSTDLRKESLAGISLFQSIQDKSFIQKFGEGSNDHRNSVYDYYTFKDGFQVATQMGDDKIIRISIGLNSDKSFSTSKGVFPGDPIKKVKKTYGDKYYERSELGTNILGYVDKKNNRTIEFWHWNGHVQYIRYDIDEME